MTKLDWNRPERPRRELRPARCNAKRAALERPFTAEQVEAIEWVRTWTGRNDRFLRSKHAEVCAGGWLTIPEARLVLRTRERMYGTPAPTALDDQARLDRCERGKLLGGRWMCACHGLAREKVYAMA